MRRERLLGSVRGQLDPAYRDFVGHYLTTRVDTDKVAVCPNCRADALKQFLGVPEVKMVLVCKRCSTFTAYGKGG